MIDLSFLANTAHSAAAHSSEVLSLGERFPAIGSLAEISVSLLLILGGVFGIVGNYGLLKLPDSMTRLHAPTMTTTLGVGLTLIASLVFFWIIDGRFTWHELIISIFLFFTAPITGHFIAKANMQLTWSQKSIPRPGSDSDWATFGDSAARSLMDDGADDRFG